MVDMNKHGWIKVSIAMVAVILVKTFSRRAHAVESCGNGNHTDTNSR